MLDEIGKPLDAVILLRVSDEVATKRLEARAEQEGRADDSPEAIRNRLRLYHELTELVVDRYQLAGIEVIVDGEQTMDDVFADDPGRPRRAWPRADDHPQEPARDREDGRGRRARRRDDRPRRRPPAPWRHDGGARRRRRRVHPRARRHSHVGGRTRATRRRSASRRTTSSSTASRTRSSSSEGDLVTIDVGVTLDGYIADSAYTFGVGEIEPETQRLLDVAQDALAAGIAEAVVGNRVGDVSHAIQDGRRGRRLLRHPQPRRSRRRPLLPRGSAHPELRRARPRAAPLRGHDDRDRADDHGRLAGCLVMDDGWTIRTTDGSMSAHFEHTVAITADGPRILTPRVGVPGGVEV